MPAIQKNRKIQVFTELADDTLLFYQMHGTEQLGQNFLYELELLSEQSTIDPNRLLGERLTISLSADHGRPRYFNGYVTRFAYQGMIEHLHHYRAEVRPWLWLLTRNANCRIFQNLSAPDIITRVFREQGFSHFETKLTGSYAQREYCVQYRESDFNFVSRLMEEEGIYYYFTHTDHEHFLVLTDAANHHAPFPGYEKIAYHPETSNTINALEEHIYQWTFARELQTGHYELTDYDFEKPNANLRVKAAAPEAHSHAEYERFDYPGYYKDTANGDHLVRQRQHEQHTQFERCEAESNARGLAVGYLFDLENYPREDQNKAHLIISANYHLFMDEYFSHRDGLNQPPLFTCRFTCQDNSRVFRTARNTPKPLVHGAQTAVVVGPAGEEIHTDKYGRVKVQFHWDRFGKRDQNSSCWIRVAHPWAGKNWGMIAIPRMGHEVVVEFLEGDPDQPLIVGSVYNADMMPPYTLPANATQTGILSRSSKGGFAANANELRFEDKKGAEQVYLHAEKNQDIEVENDETHWVGHDRQKNIDHDETVSIGRNRTETVGDNETINIGKNRTESVGSNEVISIGQNRNENVGQNEVINIGSDRTRNVGNNENVEIGKNQTLSIGEKRQTQIGKDDLNQVGKKFYLEAGDEITLKTGQASITMKKDGSIQIKGKDITIIGSGKINAKASGDMVLKGSKIAEN